MKILIIRFSSIGDIVLTTPVIRCIKKQLPDAEIHYLTGYAYREIIEHNPYISRRHYLRNSLSEIVQELKKEKFDFIADLQNNLRTALIKMQLPVRSNAFNKLNFEKWLYVNSRINLLPDVHIVDRYLETVRDLGVRNDKRGLDYFISQKEEIPLFDLPLTHLHGFISLVIGAKHNTKKLPLHKLKALCGYLAYPIILLGGPEDKEQGELIRQEDPMKIFNGCGKFSLNQSASLVRQSRVVISHDTGLMHIAAAFKKKIISVWGNTIPAFGMYPYYGNYKGEDYKQRIAEVKPLWCRPCSKLGYRRCPLGHFKCMNEINEKMIAEWISQM